MEKTKNVRQSFSKPVISGSRSGSGKLVFEHYDSLVDVWGGSANTESLLYGTSSSRLNTSDLSDDDNQITEDTFMDNDAHEEKNTPESESNQEINQEFQSKVSKKRKISAVPQLTDKKRKHFERNLSAAQHDQML